MAQKRVHRRLAIADRNQHVEVIQPPRIRRVRGLHHHGALHQRERNSTGRELIEYGRQGHVVLQASRFGTEQGRRKFDADRLWRTGISLVTGLQVPRQHGLHALRPRQSQRVWPTEFGAREGCARKRPIPLMGMRLAKRDQQLFLRTHGRSWRLLAQHDFPFPLSTCPVRQPVWMVALDEIDGDLLHAVDTINMVLVDDRAEDFRGR